MARSYARAGPSQPSQSQRTRAGRARMEEDVSEEQEEDEDEEEEVAMDLEDDEAESVRIVCLLDKKKREERLLTIENCRSLVVELTISFV